jgi:hypothetical protein
MAISKVKENSITDAAVTDDKIASGITASKLTGALPAISGANLTGVSQFTPPTISSFTPTQVANADVAFSVTITGTGFQDTPRVLLQATNGSVVTCDTVTFNSSTEIVATKAAGTLTEGVYKIQVVNPDGISVMSSTTYTNSATPVWVTSSGSLGTAVKDTAVSGNTFVVYAGDVDSTTISYSETTSVLSTANLELETFQEGGYYKVRIISSSSTVLPDSVTTYTFTIRATDASEVTADREFSISTIANTDPVFDTSTGSIGSIVDSSRDSYSLDPVTATDAEGDTLTYSISAGSLPSGLSFNSSTGAITGTADAVGSDTTSTFSITVEDGVGGSATREFSITVLAPVSQSYTSGSGSWPSPFTGTIQLLAVGGGGGGTAQGHAGGAGGGGVVKLDYSVTSGTSYNYAVGAGGSASPWVGDDTTFGTGSGTDTTFITAIGGGGGGTGDGGSGGGRSHSPGTGGLGIQTTSPLISADSRTYGFGNDGGGITHPATYPHASGGGGGANAAGQTSTSPNVSGNGGAGKDFSPIYGSVGGASGVFAGGGGAGGHNPVGSPGATSGSGGSGGGGNGGGPGGPAGTAGIANTGGGGGSGAAGGSGFIIFKY